MDISSDIPASDNNQEDLLQLGVTVWSRPQEILEKQALKEIEKFSTESKKLQQGPDPGTVLEEGELEESEDEIIEENRPHETLDIQSYIKRQEELKKISDYQKTLVNDGKENENYIKVSSRVNGDPPDKSITVAASTRKQRKSKSCNKKKRFKKAPETVTATANNNNVDGEEEEVGETLKSGSEYEPSDEDLCDTDYDAPLCDDPVEESGSASKTAPRKRKRTVVFEKVKDDALPELYKARLENYYRELEEQQKSAPADDSEPDYHSLKNGLKVPRKIWNNLFRYQGDGIKWLWELHQRSTGGILGDEMGLGKTVQIIGFLAALDYSRIVSRHGGFTGLGASLIISPATVIHQWVQHFHAWAPEFRVAVLHQSGTYKGNMSRLIREIHKCKGILITTYLGALKYKGELCERTWHYLILDEGHKIRNASAKATTAVKEIRTPHRILMTGSPMQNNLQELWSLFDFTNPGMLGSLTTFNEHFANPIIHGGFINSTPLQEATAMSMATALKNIIGPFLLRRSKSEVQDDIDLPGKSEQVLFCSITQEQKELYKRYLMSEHVHAILGQGKDKWHSDKFLRTNLLVSITQLRKICNHPDIFIYNKNEDKIEDTEETPIEDRYGHYKRSGKMIVVSALLKIWKKQKHRVLLFTQVRTMISIFEDFLCQNDYSYLKMDGGTSISSRQAIIDRFNKDENYFVFLLTTRVGGLGVNLTGADRVIIFDPDWNPATDTQARERAWRIGQERQVTIYRLLCAGTIEEKMYQRQVWKQLLSNKVLLDPKTQKFFRTSDLHDLFSLQEQVDGGNPETANIFYNSRVKMQEKLKEDIKNRRSKSKKKRRPSNQEPQFEFSKDKIEKMKALAQQISKQIGNSSAAASAEEVKKTSYQLQLEEDRERKLKEKEELKALTVQELITHNRNRYRLKEEESVNRLDDRETSINFEQALVATEKISDVYHCQKSTKRRSVSESAIYEQPSCSTSNDCPKVSESTDCSTSALPEQKLEEETDSDLVERVRSKNESEEREENGVARDDKKKRKRSKHKDRRSKADLSGEVDGEKVEGLLKSEIKKKEKKRKQDEADSSNQDNFILEKLFSKKGVSSALQHDSVFQVNAPGQSLRIHSEAKERTDKALQALRKSRLDNWKW